MTKNRSTKSALLSSAVALMLCFAMLLGTTFAWFTDSVTSANNVIQSGNLDIELEYWNGTAWVDVAGKNDVLTNKLWEPGVTEVAYLRVANAGSLALKYQLGINVISETEGKNAAGEAFKLSDYIMFGVVEDVNGNTTPYATREEAVKALASSQKISAGYTKAESMAAGDELYLALVVYMPTEVGNVANHDGVNKPSIDLGINIFATQMTAEEDSFGSDYDAGAPWLGGINTDWYTADANEYVIKTADELAGLAQLVNNGITFQNKVIKLGGNIDLNDLAWTPIGADLPKCFSGTLDGNGYTVYNLNVETVNNAGLVGYAAYGGNIKNLTVKNATVKANDYAGVIMGRGYTDIDNCRVENATVITTPYFKNGVYDGGAKAGGIIGQLLEGAGNTVTNCSVNNVTIYGFRDVGGVVGMVHNNNSCSGNTATNVTIGYVLCEEITADKNENAGAIYGRVQSSATVSPAKDSAENQAFILKYIDMVSTKVEFAEAISEAADAGSGDTTIYLTGDINLKGTAWTPIKVDGYNGAGIITVEGNGATITGLSAPLFAGGFAGKSGIVIKNLTIADSDIVSTSGLGGGAFVDSADSMQVVTLENCHLVNSTVSGERAGGLIGWVSGYAKENDGPVKTYVTVTNCSVINSTVTGAGSAGAIAGHPGASDYTYTTIENCVIKNVDVVSNETGSWRTGAVVGTANNGHIVINNVTVEEVTLTQNGIVADDVVLYGRFVPSGTGTLVIDGVAIN